MVVWWGGFCAGSVPCPTLTAQQLLEASLCWRSNGTAIVPIKHGSADTRKGMAIFPFASRLNHGCVPNVVVHYQGAKLIVRSIVPLRAGDVLRHCYGPQVRLER